MSWDNDPVFEDDAGRAARLAEFAYRRDLAAVERSKASLSGVFYHLDRLNHEVRHHRHRQLERNCRMLQKPELPTDVLTRFDHGFGKYDDTDISPDLTHDITTRSGLLKRALPVSVDSAQSSALVGMERSPADRISPGVDGEIGGGEPILEALLFDPIVYASNADPNPDELTDTQLLAHYLLVGDEKRIDPHPLISVEWYYGHYQDALTETGLTALQHYVLVGAFEGLQPHPLFDPKHYLGQVEHYGGENPLCHYLAHGDENSHSPHPLFDPIFYRSQLGEEDNDATVSLVHYLSEGDARGLDPHPMFSTDWYYRERPEAKSAPVSALVHYLTSEPLGQHAPSPIFESSGSGIEADSASEDRSRSLIDYVEIDVWRGHPASDLIDAIDSLRLVAPVSGVANRRTALNERINQLTRIQPHPFDLSSRERRDLEELFDERFYLAQLGEEAEVRGESELLEHYLQIGWRTGLNPNLLFDTVFYSLSEEGVLASGEQPLLHFVRYGPQLGGRTHPLFDGRYYLDENEDVRHSGANPLAHYMKHGGTEGRRPSSHFDAENYLKLNQDVKLAGENPLSHWLKYGTLEKRKGGPNQSG